MKKGFYPKLAWEGIRKNRRLYVPYLLTCAGMVMMHYIISFLSVTPALEGLPGGGTIGAMLDLGSGILALFSALFLFYSNSFLLRRRNKEFGLYNILGMDKGSIGRILFWESLTVAALSLTTGIALGMGLSKLFELGLVNLMAGTVRYDFTVSPESLGKTARTFAVIFVLLFLNSLRQVSRNDPVALLRSENAGEKPPKANWLLGVAGAGILGMAYWLAVVIEDPISALVWFFVAVAMVILATYLLFVAGSVVLCRILQGNKRYYYKASHFVSVSSMAYRMKRNGAGLASICILLTMVLVMLSSTAALFIGAEDSLNTRYPRDIAVELKVDRVEDISEERVGKLRDAVHGVLEEHGAAAENSVDCRMAGAVGLLADGFFQPDISQVSDFDLRTYANVVQLYLVPLSDYNRTMGENWTLAPDEVLIYAHRMKYTAPTFQTAVGDPLRVKAVVEHFAVNGDSTILSIPAVFVFVPDFEAAVMPLQTLAAMNGDGLLTIGWSYGFDLELDERTQIEIYRRIRDTDWHQVSGDSQWRYSGNVECREANRGDFYGTYGGLFFLGLMLSAVFLAAAVLIIYYKQISEGYEDQARFEIMQKVGMTKGDIRRSINSQMLTVFFLPLITAGIHLCFAFPMVRKLLLLFNLQNTPLLIATTAVSFLIFGFFYALVYRLTSNAYFSIVSGVREERL